jgi:hypothetical protein
LDVDVYRWRLAVTVVGCSGWLLVYLAVKLPFTVLTHGWFNNDLLPRSWLFGYGSCVVALFAGRATGRVEPAAVGCCPFIAVTAVVTGWFGSVPSPPPPPQHLTVIWFTAGWFIVVGTTVGRRCGFVHYRLVRAPAMTHCHYHGMPLVYPTVCGIIRACPTLRLLQRVVVIGLVVTTGGGLTAATLGGSSPLIGGSGD